VIEQIIQLLPHTIHPFYYRTHDGSEIDLVLVKGLKPVACIEVKYSTSPTVSKGVMEAIKNLKCKTNYVIIPGTAENYPLNKEITICDARTFLMQHLSKLF
jgi:predicted AAA+ superfamily ATPase